MANRNSKNFRKRIVNIDKDTGRELSGVVVLCGVKHNPYAKGWVMSSQEALEVIAKDKEIKGETYRVLMILLAKLDFENWIRIPQTEIAKELEMNKQNVSKSIKLLETKEIILRGPKLGHSYAFRLNPFFGWKGNPINLEKYREEKEKKRTKEFKNKSNGRRNQKIGEFSKKYNIPIDKVEEFLGETT